MNVAVPAGRVESLERVRDALLAARHIAITTHVNADGDGSGCESALAAWLADRGHIVHIANPTPFPDTFRHLVRNASWIVDPATAQGRAALEPADMLLVLDTGEPKRIGKVAALFAGRPHIVIDHHLPSDNGFDGLVIQDASACATGELVYDLLTVAGLARPWPPLVCEALYTALLTDTGSFRYSNTTPRTHVIAADLLEQGVDPEAVYRRIYGTVPLSRVRLLRRALDSLETDPELPITWMTVDRQTVEEIGAVTDDFESILEHARNVEGTEVAVLFREMADGSTKVSLRSTGRANVNAIARAFGGGGHEKASGILVGDRLQNARTRILDAVRRHLRDIGLPSQPPSS